MQLVDAVNAKKLGDYVELQRGNTYKSALLGQAGPVLLGLASIARNGGFRSDNLKTYGGPSDERMLLVPGDIYVSLKDVTQSADLLGAVARVPETVPLGRLTQDTVKLVFRESDAPKDYIYWLLRTPQYRSYCRAHATGTTNLGLPREDFLAFEIPNLNQRSEVLLTLLQALENKIELNRRMNETLEAMVRAIFKDWFVDFGPTRAKVEGRSPYLTPEIWNRFPDALDDEDKPVGWKRDRIGKHVVAKKGLSYKGAGLTDETSGVPLHNLNSILEGGGYKHDGLKHYSGDYKPRHIVHPGDLIVANTEQGFDHLLIGYSALVPAWVGELGLFSHHVFKVEPRPASPLSRVWLHFALSASWIGESVRRFSNGTTVNMLPQDAFEIPEVIVPSSELVRAFDEFVGPVLRRQEDLVGESRTLGQTRDLLLPKLMSGEIRLAEAEKAVEAVA